jgi:cytochrome c oxidase subunit IV
MSDKAHPESLTVNVIIYAAILAIAGLQVLLAYRHGTIGQHVFEMLALAMVQAGLGVLFFMHLYREKRSLMLALVPATIFVLLMMNMIWTDSFRIVHMKPWAN